MRAQDGRAVQGPTDTTSATTCANSTASRSASVCRPMPIDDYVVGRFFDGPGAGRTRSLRPRLRRVGPRDAEDVRRAASNSSNDFAIRPGWPSGSSRKRTRTIAWWRPNWRSDGRVALRELRDGRGRATTGTQRRRDPSWLPSTTTTRQALIAAGTSLPQWWRAGRFTREQQKALLRCLIDKVVLHRLAADRVRCRIVWRGGETTTADVAVTTGAVQRHDRLRRHEAADPGRGPTRARRDDEIAAALTRRASVAAARHGVAEHGQGDPAAASNPGRDDNRIPDASAENVTVPQLATRLNVERHWAVRSHS